jgi:hypothetical protein
VNTGTKVTPAAGRDRVLTAALMVMRTGAAAAFLLGLGFLFQQWSFASWGDVHMTAGILVLLSILAAGVRALMLGKGATLLLIGLADGVAGAGVGLAHLGGLAHLTMMVLAVGVVEMAAAKIRKA